MKSTAKELTDILEDLVTILIQAEVMEEGSDDRDLAALRDRLTEMRIADGR